MPVRLSNPIEQNNTDTPNRVEALLAELDALAERASAVLDELDHATEPDDRLGLSSSAARHGAVLTTRLNHAADRATVWGARQVARSRAHLDDAISTPNRWTEHHLGVTKRDAHRLGRAAAVLDHLPIVGNAFTHGDIRLAHLDSIARIIPARLKGQELADAWALLANCQHELLTFADRTDLSGFDNACARVRERLDIDGPPDRSKEPSQLWLTKLFDGRWSLTADLTADDGAQLAAYLQRRTRAELKAQNADTDSSNGESSKSDEDHEPIAITRARALMSLCCDGAGAKAPGRIALHLHADLEDLASRGVHVSKPAHTEAGHDITADTLWGLLANADVTPYYTDGGRTLWYGTTRRLAPDDLRRVLAHRDRHCRFPGCHAPPVWTDAHHVQHHEHDGPTDPDNCLLLCRFHHTMHHQHGWNIEYDPPNNEVTATAPDGKPHTAEQHWRHHHRQTDPDRALILARLADLRPAA